MTKEDFLVVNSLLYEKDFDELDRLEFWMGYESKTKEHIPDDWFALTPAPFEYPLQRPKDTTDWSSFRREAAKDILAGMMSNPEKISIRGERLATIDGYVCAAIEITDELIRQIKEK